jgi:hypothetical protein
MLCYYNLDETAHDVVITGRTRIQAKNRTRCRDEGELGAMVEHTLLYWADKK